MTEEYLAGLSQSWPQREAIYMSGKMTMIERVARAIAWDSIKDEAQTWKHDTPTTEANMWVDPKFERVARAAIAAMREPTGGILDVLMDIMPPETALVRWQAMIDAALEEK